MVHENYHGGSDIFPEILPPESDKGFPAGENCDKIKRKLRNFQGKGDGAMDVSVRSLGLSGISGYEVTVECFLSEAPGLRRGGPAGYRRAGSS